MADGPVRLAMTVGSVRPVTGTVYRQMTDPWATTRRWTGAGCTAAVTPRSLGTWTRAGRGWRGGRARSGRGSRDTGESRSV